MIEDDENISNNARALRDRRYYDVGIFYGATRYRDGWPSASSMIVMGMFGVFVVVVVSHIVLYYLTGSGLPSVELLASISGGSGTAVKMGQQMQSTKTGFNSGQQSNDNLKQDDARNYAAGKDKK